MTDIFPCVTTAEPPTNGGTNNSGAPQTPAAETPTGGSNGTKGGKSDANGTNPDKNDHKGGKGRGRGRG